MGKLGLTQAKDSLKVTQPRVKIQIRVPEPVFLVVTLGCLPGWSSLGPLPSSLGGLRGAGGHGEAGRGQEEDRRPPRQSPYMQGLSGHPPKRDFSPGFGCIAPRPHRALSQASDRLSRGPEPGNVQRDLPRKGASGRLVPPASGCSLRRGSHGNAEPPVQTACWESPAGAG